jgi:hypothetical protein
LDLKGPDSFNRNLIAPAGTRAKRQQEDVNSRSISDPMPSAGRKNSAKRRRQPHPRKLEDQEARGKRTNNGNVSVVSTAKHESSVLGTNAPTGECEPTAGGPE